MAGAPSSGFLSSTGSGFPAGGRGPEVFGASSPEARSGRPSAGDKRGAVLSFRVAGEAGPALGSSVPMAVGPTTPVEAKLAAGGGPDGAAGGSAMAAALGPGAVWERTGSSPADGDTPAPG